MLRASLLLALGSVLTQSIIAQKCEYEAPYNLGSTPTLTATSGLKINNAVYYIQACGSVNASYCPDSDDTQQECFAYTDNDGKEHSYSLGTSKNTTWHANGEWVQGAVSYTSDITIGTTDLLCNAKVSSNFTTIYTCETGLDTVKVLNEPATSKDGCDFLFKVDSSIVCKYQESLISSSSSSSSTGESSSSNVESSSSSERSSSSSPVSSSSAVSSSSSAAPVSSSSSATGRSSSSAVSSSSGASSSSVPVVSSSSEHPANSSSTGGWLSSSSSEVPISSSSSEPVVISSSSSEPDMSSSSSSTGEESGGMSATEQLAIGLGAGLGGLVLVLLVALCVVVRKLQAATSGKTSLIDEDSSSGRYNTLKNTEEGRGKKSKNERL